jgi:hypothetical protein
MDLTFQMTVLTDYLAYYGRKILLLLGGFDPGYFNLKGGNGLDLEFFESQVFLRHGRQRLRGLKNIDSEKTEVFNRLDTSVRELGVTLMKKNAALGINGSCESHSAFKIFPFYEFQISLPG